MSAFQTLQRDSGILIVLKPCYLLLQLCIFFPFRCKGKGIPCFPCLELPHSSSSSFPACFGFRHQPTLSQPANKPQTAAQPLPKSLCFDTCPRVGPSRAWGLPLVRLLLGHLCWEPRVQLCPHSLLRRQGLELLIKLQAVNSGQIILAS